MMTKDEFYKPPKKPPTVRIEHATVVRLNSDGEPLLRFLGEQIASPKIYPRLESYVPKVGQRVILMGSPGSMVIIGGVA